FKLSYLAVLGIVVLYPKLNALLSIKNQLLAKIWSYAMLSVAAQLATFPLVLYYFHFFPVYFLPANILIIAPISIVVYLSLLVLIIPYGIVNDWLASILENLVLIVYKILNLFEELPHATLGNIWIEPWHYIVQYLLLLSCVSFFFMKNK